MSSKLLCCMRGIRTLLRWKKHIDCLIHSSVVRPRRIQKSLDHQRPQSQTGTAPAQGHLVPLDIARPARMSCRLDHNRRAISKHTGIIVNATYLTSITGPVSVISPSLLIPKYFQGLGERMTKVTARATRGSGNIMLSLKVNSLRVLRQHCASSKLAPSFETRTFTSPGE